MFHRNPEYSSDDFRQYFLHSFLSWPTAEGARPAWVHDARDGNAHLIVYNSNAKQENVKVTIERLCSMGWEVFSRPQSGYVQLEPHVIVDLQRTHARTTQKGVHQQNTAVIDVNSKEREVLAMFGTKVGGERMFPDMNRWSAAACAAWFRKRVSLADGLRAMFSAESLGTVLSPDACLVLSDDEDQSDYPVLMLYQGAVVRKYSDEKSYVPTGLIDDAFLATEVT